MNTLALPFIVESLEIMNGTHPDIASIESTYADGWSQTDKRDVTSYIKALTDFIIGIISTYTLLHPLAGIAQRLQDRAVDVVQAYEDVQWVILGMKGLREDIGNAFNIIYLQAERMADKLQVSPTLPRTAKRQQHYRNNVEARTPEEYYRRALAIPMLDIYL